MRNWMTILVVATIATAGCTTPDSGDRPPVADLDTCEGGTDSPNPLATLHTSMGDITGEIFREQVPMTANNFLSLAADGYYDGTKFHRVITDFMMQGGDPEGTGRGGEAFGGGTIDDEFHHQLRHEGKGVFSMANAGPNTGSSQFFITFTDTPWLDDKHAVFGQVVDGMDVVDKVHEEAASGNGAPKTTVTLESISVCEPEPPEDPEIGIALWSPDTDHPAPAGGPTSYVVVAKNTGEVATEVTATANGATVESQYDSFTLPAGQRVAFIVTQEIPTDATGDLEATVTVSGGGASDSITLTAEVSDAAAIVQEGDTVEAHYIGLTVDGRIFDTSVESVAKYADANGLGYATFQLRPDYQTFQFTPGQGVIQGFTDLAVGTAEGAIASDRIPAKDAYGEQGQSPLAGRDLIFQLEILDIQE